MENCNFALALLSLHTCPLGPNLPSPAELFGRKMHGILLNINRKSVFVTGLDDDEIKHTLQKHQETMKCNIDKSIMCKSTHLYFQVLLSWSRERKRIYGITIDVPEPNVHVGHCYKIKLSSGSIITRNSIHVHLHTSKKNLD